LELGLKIRVSGVQFPPWPPINDGPFRAHFSTEGIWGAFDPAGLVVEEVLVVLHKADQPDFLADLGDADVLAGEHPTQVDFAPPDADTPAFGFTQEWVFATEPATK
jgi:hypothetical protein